MVDDGLTDGAFVEHRELDGDFRVELWVQDWIRKRLEPPFGFRSFPEQPTLELQMHVLQHVEQSVDGYQNGKGNC